MVFAALAFVEETLRLAAKALRVKGYRSTSFAKQTKAYRFLRV